MPEIVEKKLKFWIFGFHSGKPEYNGYNAVAYKFVKKQKIAGYMRWIVALKLSAKFKK